MKVFFRRIHLYLSLAAGLVIFIACLTGALLVFEHETVHALHPERYFVEAGKERLPLSQLVANVQQAAPGAKIASVKVYPDPERSVEIAYSPAAKKQEGKKAAGNKALVTADGGSAKPAAASGKTAGGKAEAGKPAPPRRPSMTAFVNPYTGEVLELFSYRESFFFQVMALHRWLLGSNDGIGKYIVGISTIVFLFILITGIVLWWPRNAKIMKQRLKVKWTGGWKRLNHDLHIVLGFYSFIILFILSFTGLAWSFEWFNKAIYTVTRSEMKSPPPPKSTPVAGSGFISPDQALQTAAPLAGQVQFYQLRLPADTAGIYAVSALPAGAHEAASDSYYIDAYSGRLLGTLLYEEKNSGQRLRGLFKPIHTASIYGTPSKIVGFVACLLGVSFPVTGTILWINRLKKKKKKNPKEGFRLLSRRRQRNKALHQA